MNIKRLDDYVKHNWKFLHGKYVPVEATTVFVEFKDGLNYVYNVEYYKDGILYCNTVMIKDVKDITLLGFTTVGQETEFVT
jgi:hypothetical protein